MNYFGLALLIGVVFAAVAKFAFRDFLCWYWKINENIRRQDIIIDLLKEQNELLKKIIKSKDQHIDLS